MVYLVYSCIEDESPEDWNVFYTDCEAFDTATKRDTREAELEAAGYETYTVDLQVR